MFLHSYESYLIKKKEITPSIIDQIAIDFEFKSAFQNKFQK